MERKENQSCDDAFAGCTIISWVKHHGQVFISSPGINYPWWFHDRVPPCPGRSCLHQCFMGTAVYFQIFHRYAQILFGLANKIVFGFVECCGHVWWAMCKGHCDDIRSVQENNLVFGIHPHVSMPPVCNCRLNMGVVAAQTLCFTIRPLISTKVALCDLIIGIVCRSTLIFHLWNKAVDSLHRHNHQEKMLVIYISLNLRNVSKICWMSTF